ncbi:MAG: cell wall hydrolase [Rhodothermales bacterium]
MESFSHGWKIRRLAGLALIVAMGFVGQAAAGASPAGDGEAVLEALRKLPPLAMDEVMWLARCILSESDRADEQELVAWVVRNRVETRYRGDSYREVVLEPLQFSAFNTPSPRRTYLLGLNQHSKVDSWLGALQVAMKVYDAPDLNRPLSRETRHFYSPVSMKGGKTPPWAVNATPLDLADRSIDPKRFLFFEQIDESQDPFLASQAPTERIRSFQEETRQTLQAARPRTSTRSTRLQPSGRVLRPARPSVGGTRKVGWK